jgi:hypothetical protein
MFQAWQSMGYVPAHAPRRKKRLPASPAVLGANIRRERTARSVTQEKLAELCGPEHPDGPEDRKRQPERSDYDSYPNSARITV